MRCAVRCTATFRKPLIVMSPKSLLRHPRAVSTLADLADGKFQSVIDDSVSPGDAHSGCSSARARSTTPSTKERSERDRADVAIVRVEQLYPFPATELGEMLRRYSSATQIRWVQEEPRNQGAWQFVGSAVAGPRLARHRLRADGKKPRVQRPAATRFTRPKRRRSSTRRFGGHGRRARTDRASRIAPRGELVQREPRRI